MIEILIVDDHQMFAEGIASLFNQTSDMRVIGISPNGAAALRFLKEKQVDIILMDVDMPEMNGIKATFEIRTKYPNIKVLVLTSHDNGTYARQLLSMGAVGYILKNTAQNELKLAVRLVAEGETFFPKSVQESIIQDLAKEGNSPKKMLQLSPREQEVLELIAQELSAQEIADQLKIGFHTVNAHRKNILRKLEVKNTAGIIKEAIRRGLIQV